MHALLAEQLETGFGRIKALHGGVKSAVILVCEHAQRQPPLAFDKAVQLGPQTAQIRGDCAPLGGLAANTAGGIGARHG